MGLVLVNQPQCNRQEGKRFIGFGFLAGFADPELSIDPIPGVIGTSAADLGISVTGEGLEDIEIPDQLVLRLGKGKVDKVV